MTSYMIIYINNYDVGIKALPIHNQTTTTTILLLLWTSGKRTVLEHC